MRKILSSLCLLLMSLLSLAGCGGAAATPTGTTPTANAGPPDNSLSVYVTKVFTDGSNSTFYSLNASDGKERGHAQVMPDAGFQARAVNGVIYVTDQGGVTALKASDGSKLWHQDVGRATLDAIVDGVVYGTAYNGDSPSVVTTIYALGASDGKKLWQVEQPGGFVEQAADGVVYVGFAPMEGAFGLSALKASDGSLRWHYDVPEEVQIHDLINGRVYVDVSEPASSVSDIPAGYLAALDVQTGKELWRYDAGDAGSVREIGANDQTVYAISNGGQSGAIPTTLYALSASDGSEQWHKDSKDDYASSYVLAGDTLFLNTSDGTISALKASDGSQEWQTKISDPYPANQYSGTLEVQSASGLLYVSTESQTISALNIKDGTTLWHAEVPDFLSFVAATSSSVYVNGNNGQTSAVTALNASDGSQRWTYGGANFDIGSATVG